jgi:hypothetical protein
LKEVPMKVRLKLKVGGKGRTHWWVKGPKGFVRKPGPAAGEVDLELPPGDYEVGVGDWRTP